VAVGVQRHRDIGMPQPFSRFVILPSPFPRRLPVIGFFFLFLSEVTYNRDIAPSDLFQTRPD